MYWPALVDNDEVQQIVVLADGRRIPIDRGPVAAPTLPPPTAPSDVVPVGPAIGEPLGACFAARSGDKGGNANVGIWAPDDAGYAWLHANLGTRTLQQMLPEAAGLEVRRYELPQPARPELRHRRLPR